MPGCSSSSTTDESEETPEDEPVDVKSGFVFPVLDDDDDTWSMVIRRIEAELVRRGFPGKKSKCWRGRVRERSPRDCNNSGRVSSSCPYQHDLTSTELLPRRLTHDTDLRRVQPGKRAATKVLCLWDDEAIKIRGVEEEELVGKGKYRMTTTTSRAQTPR